MTKFLAAAAAAALMTLSAQAASAQSGVTWSDLDVTTPAGAVELDARIMTAARRVCRNMQTTGSRRNPISFCESEVREAVTRSMDAETREAYARARAEARANPPGRN